MIGSVRTTYRGYDLIIDTNDILAISPDGDTHCAPSMVTIRRWVNKHRTLGEREPNASLPASTPLPHSLVSSRSPNTITPQL